MKIHRRKHHSVPRLNMASMPDLIFTVLFFFMIVTHMRSETPIMKIEVPQGTELTKPQHRAVQTLRNRINDDDRPYYVVSIRADKNTPMGVITDVKEELRRVGALKIRYNATEIKK